MKLEKVDPLHIQIANLLRSEIQNGKLVPGEKLKPEESLAKDFDVSRATIRAALKILENEHYLISKHGSGTFISENVVFISNAINQLRSTTEMARASGLDIKNKMISLDIERANKRVQTSLGLNKNENIVKLERIGFIKKEPIIYSIDIFPLHIAPEIANQDNFEGSLLAYLEEKCNVQIKCANATVSAVGSIEWPIEGFKNSLPALLFEQVHYDQNEKPVLYSIDYYRSDHFKFHIFRKRDVR